MKTTKIPKIEGNTENVKITKITKFTQILQNCQVKKVNKIQQSSPKKKLPIKSENKGKMCRKYKKRAQSMELGDKQLCSITSVTTTNCLHNGGLLESQSNFKDI